MERLNDQKGVVLLQVLMMSVILSSIAMMLIQWQYGRYVAAYRMETGARSRAIAESGLNSVLSDLFVTNKSELVGSTSVLVKGDPVFGDCTVTVVGKNGPGGASLCAQGNICASFDPCSNCTNSCL